MPHQHYCRYLWGHWTVGLQNPQLPPWGIQFSCNPRDNLSHHNGNMWRLWKLPFANLGLQNSQKPQLPGGHIQCTPPPVTQAVVSWTPDPIAPPSPTTTAVGLYTLTHALCNITNQGCMSLRRFYKLNSLYQLVYSLVWSGHNSHKFITSVIGNWLSPEI